MTTFPISSSNDLKKYNVNKINQDSGGILSDSRYPYLLYQGLHCGGFDRLLYDQSSIDGLVGCGLNPYGFYGIQYGETGNKPVFLLSGKPFNTPDWGQAYAGEFRVGDNVKEDNGSLVGKNWLWFNPKNGLNISGPILRTNSSDVNIIQYPDFSITTEFVYSMEYNNSGQYFRATGDQYLVVKGYKTIDGASFIRGSVLYYASLDFAGTVYIQGVTYDSDHNELSRSQSVINILPDKWKQYNFVVRLTEGEYFELGLAVRDYTSGTIDFKRWSAFKVFQAAIDSSELPETLPGEDKSVVIDKTGIKGYWPADKYNPGIPDFEQETIDGKIKTFEVSAANGSAYFRGSILVNGFIHSGPRYKPIYKGSTLQKTYIAGCGINEYGVYGIKGVESGGEYVQGNSRFLIAAKSIDTSGSSDSSHYWGDEITEGELRVGLGIRYDKFNHRLLNDAGTEESSAYMWFFPGNSSYSAELKIKGNIHATSGIFSGNIILDGGVLIAYKTNDSNTYTAMDNTGFSAHSSDKGWTFFVSNGDTWGTREGEFRVGEGIDNISSSTNFMQFRPGYGLKIVANGLDISPVSSSFGGGDNTELQDLTINGNLVINSGIISSQSASDNSQVYINNTGISGYNGSSCVFLLATKDHSWLSETELRIGDVENLANDYFRYSVSNGLEIKGNIHATSGTFEGTVEAGNMRIGPNVNGSNDGIYINSSNYWYDDGTLVAGGIEVTNGTTTNIGGTNTTIGNNAKLDDLTINGTLKLNTGYLYAGGDSSSAQKLYLNYEGVSGTDNGTFKFLLSSNHPWYSNSYVFAIGDNINPSNSSNNLFRFTSSGLEIKINGKTVLAEGDVAWDNGSIVNKPNDVELLNNWSESNITTITRPEGASLSGGSSSSGAIVIHLPQSWTNTMLKCWVDVFLYNNDQRSFSLLVGGYTYNSSSQWVNEFAHLVGSTASDNRVRFGHNGSKCCIVIGEESSVWSYPKIIVRDFQAGHSNYSINQWKTGWDITFESDLSGYTFTGDISDALIDATSIKDQGSLATKDDINWDLNYIPQMPNVLIPSISGESLRAGLNINNDYIGYSTDGTVGGLKCYMNSSGDFYLKGSSGYLFWDRSADSLTVKGKVYATSGYFTGNIYASGGYFSNDFYVGTDSGNRIRIAYNSNKPYIQSENYGGSGSSSYGWKISYDGYMYINHIKPYSNNQINLHTDNGSSKYANIYLSSYNDYPSCFIGTGSSSSRYTQVNIGSNSYGDYISLYATGGVSIYSPNSSGITLGSNSSSFISIKPYSTGNIYLGYGDGYSYVNVNAYSFKTSSSCRLGFFGNSPITRPEVFIPDDGAWHPGSTNTSEIRDDLDNLHSIVTDLLNALQNDSNGLGLIHYHT